MSSAASLPYHEPGIVTILILASFLLLQNAINYLFDHLLYCGLIGQIAIGVAWGTPGANWLSLDVQNTVMQLGYLGLILLVYEGGLQTDIQTLKSNLILSSVVALIGISVPIGLSFTLQGFVNGVTPVQAFAAGAALCSTSLGTTFTILSTSGLSHSRLGVVLSSAAMMDDIVGLVMSGIISSLGESSDFKATTVIRPVFVSITFAVLLPLICAFVLRPLTKLSHKIITTNLSSRLYRLSTSKSAAFIFHVFVLSALIAGASYAGTSSLFAAYLAGASITWWDGLCADLRLSSVQDEQDQGPKSDRPRLEAKPQVSDSLETDTSKMRRVSDPRHLPASRAEISQSSVSPRNIPESPASSVNRVLEQQQHESREHFTGNAIFEKHIHPALQAILKPFFFASIGFSIPISQMFTGSVLWRGIIYSILMIIGKLLCGLCLIRFASPILPIQPFRRLLSTSLSSCFPWPVRTEPKSASETTQDTKNSDQPGDVSMQSPQASATTPSARPKRPRIPKPMSLYPAALLGSAMVARGEIGFLISSVAESDGVFGPARDGGSSELFLIVTWAILLCTILGPLTVGLMVRRVRRLQELERSRQTGRRDPLGIWGISR